ncbi:hypothetical protein HAX54_005834 [Datura stramonium]|uniref:Uncharacterized protein n=1 Tax=Datura stramonium TaxID=4076 RepID=A0ABS8TBV7_DATST|nr:hypothetical protein [Datura stramonium]
MVSFSPLVNPRIQEQIIYNIRARASFRVEQEYDPFLQALLNELPSSPGVSPLQILSLLTHMLAAFFLLIVWKIWINSCIPTVLQLGCFVNRWPGYRPYRLNWPTSTLVFDIYLKVFRGAVQKLQDAGAKIPRGCMSIHVPSESFSLENILRTKGFSGTRPSIWAFQGLPVVNLASFKDILSISATKKWLDNLFMSYGFRVKMIEYDEVARGLSKDYAKRASGVGTSILFVAEHLLFSDDQMKTWRTEFQRIEEEEEMKKALRSSREVIEITI